MKSAYEIQDFNNLNSEQALLLFSYLIKIENDLLLEDNRKGWVNFGMLLQKLNDIVLRDDESTE